jgi:lipooligosaccharide transport system permease protein
VVVWRDRYWESITTLASPLTFFVIFSFGLGDYLRTVGGLPYVLFVTPGLVSVAAIQASFEQGAWSMWFHRHHQRTIDEYRVNPITVYEIVIGKILAGFIEGAAKGLLVAVVVFPLVDLSVSAGRLVVYVLYLTIGSMVFSCLGILTGTLMDKPEQVGRVQAVFIMPLIFLGGLFYPLETYPEALRWLFELLPTAGIFDGAREMLLHGTLLPGYFLSLALYAVGTFALAVVVFERRIER